jgi:hypothetical protein
VADDDVVYPVTGDEDLATVGLPIENDDDITEDAAALLGINMNGAGGAEPATTATGTLVVSNTNNIDDTGTATSSLGKRKSVVWDDFDEIKEDVNGEMVRTKATYKMCRTTLSARSAAGTGHLIRHQNSCKAKVANAARVQSRLAFNPDGSLHNWNYDPVVARSELCRLIARLDLPLGIGDTDA